MNIIPPLLIMCALFLELTLEKRRKASYYYKYVSHARRRVFVGRLFWGSLLAIAMYSSYYYPPWLRITCYVAVAVTLSDVLVRSSISYYSTLSFAHKHYGSRSAECTAIEYMLNREETPFILLLQTVLMASFVALVIDDSIQAFLAVFLSIALFGVLICFLFWLSNRFIYKDAMEKLTTIIIVNQESAECI